MTRSPTDRRPRGGTAAPVGALPSAVRGVSHLLSTPWFTPRSRWTRAALVAAVLLVGSVLPTPSGRHPEFRRFGPDKLLHLIGHGGFAATVADALGSRLGSRPAAVVAVPLSTGYAALLGRLQERVPGREPERADLAASLLGSVLGAVGWLYRSDRRDPDG